MNRGNRIVSVFLLLLSSVLTSRIAFSQPSAQMLVTTDWLAAHLKDKNIVVLDIGKDRRAFYAGHIPSAEFLDLSKIADTNARGWLDLPSVSRLKTVLEQAGVGDRSRIILYGDNKGLFAARAYFTLDYLGLGNRTSILDGGLEKWNAEHRALSSDVAVPRISTLKVLPHPAVVTNLPTVAQIVSTRTVPLVDARAPADFAGVRGSVGTVRSGHIPGARDVFWADNLTGTDIPVLKPVASIRARYAAAGLKPGTKVIVYCHGGMQASYDYFTLKLAGFQPILYAGSFAEWGTTFGTPVETTGD